VKLALALGLKTKKITLVSREYKRFYSRIVGKALIFSIEDKKRFVALAFYSKRRKKSIREFFRSKGRGKKT
jgi:hypothetical protein